MKAVASNYGNMYSLIYDEVYSEFTPSDAQLKMLAAYSRQGALELGVGSGRVAIPLAGIGIQVTGLDNSSEMLIALAEKLKKEKSDLNFDSIFGCITDIKIPRKFSLVYAPFNFFCLIGNDERKSAALKNVASMLTADGVLIVEIFVPHRGKKLPDGTSPAIFPMKETAVDVKAVNSLYTILTASSFDEHKAIWSLSEILLKDGQLPRVIFSELHCVTPDHFDSVALKAGLALVKRFSDWNGSEFLPASGKHVSIYRKSETAK